MANRSSCLIGAFCTILTLQSQALAAQELTADDVIQKAYQAMGGQETWSTIQSTLFSGSFSTYSEKSPFRMYRKRPNLYRFEYKLGDWPVTLGYDGKIAWWLNSAFFVEAQWPVEAPLAHAAAIAVDAEFNYPMLDYRRRGHEVELAGVVDLDGQDTFKLMITLGSGAIEAWFLDVETFLPVARISQGADSLRPVELRTFFSDYREVSGFLFPHYIEQELGSTYQLMEIDEIRINVDLENSFFAMPLPAGMQRLRNMAGEWTVKISYEPFPGLPWLETEANSDIRASFHGALLEEELSYVMRGGLRHVRRLRSYDRFRELYRTVYFDNLTSHVNILEGRLEDARLVATNLETGTFWEAKGKTRYNREVIYDLEPDGFKIDWETSTDGGDTWNPTVRFVYSRRADKPETAPTGYQ